MIVDIENLRKLLIEIFNDSYVCKHCRNIILPKIEIEEDSVNVITTFNESRYGMGNQEKEYPICEECYYKYFK